MLFLQRYRYERRKTIASVSSVLSVRSGAANDDKEFMRFDDSTGRTKFFIKQPKEKQEIKPPITITEDDDLPF